MQAVSLFGIGWETMDRGAVVMVQGQVGRIGGDVDRVEASDKSRGHRVGVIHRMRAMSDHGTVVGRDGKVMFGANVVDQRRRGCRRWWATRISRGGLV